MLNRQHGVGPVPTLGESLQEAGYRTAAINANGLLSGPQFRHGFDEVRLVGGYTFFKRSFFLQEILSGQHHWYGMQMAATLDLHKETASNLRNQARSWLEKNNHSPFFLYLQLVDPHWPYYDRDNGFAAEAARPGLTPLSHVDLLKPGRSKLKDPAKIAASPRVKEMVARYDDEIRSVDSAIVDLMHDLETLQLAPSTLVIITADHGEEFFEHGGFSHGHDLYEEQIHVPLLFLWPTKNPTGLHRTRPLPRVDTPASLIDLYPTVLDYLGVLGPLGPERTSNQSGQPNSPALRGRSLRPIIEGQASPAPRPVTSETPVLFPNKPFIRTHREGRFKVRLQSLIGKETGVQVFDLSKDPFERHPVADDSPSVIDIIARAKKRTSAPSPAPSDALESAPELDAGLEELRALGYIE